MHLFLTTGPRLARLSALVPLLIFTACSQPTPTVAATPAPPGATPNLPTSTAALSDTATPNPTDTVTATTTISPTAETTATQPPAQSSAPPPAGPPGASGIGNNVWFMGQLIAYFSKLGTYPPEQVPARPPNVNPLTGLEVANPALLQRRPILARIGNDPNARPQAGLNQADLVFEELIDQHNGVFALTRLSAVYLGQTGAIRPLRSARPVNASLQPMFDAALAHSGASNGTRFLLGKLPWGSPLTQSLNLDDLWFGSAYCQIGTYWVTRFASSTERIHEILTAKHLEKTVPLRGFDFSTDAPAGTPVHSVSFDHSPWPITRVGVTLWNYDPGSGRYLRFAGGVPHNSLQYPLTASWGGNCTIGSPQTSSQVSAANVVVINAEYEPTDIQEDVNHFYSAFIQLVGSGPVRVYRDGVQILGEWRRPSLQHFLEFVDPQGTEITLKPGNTWFEIAPLNYVPTTR